MDVLEVLWLTVVAYLVGSVPSAYLIARKVRRVDIRTIGNYNMGAANVFRKVHPAAGIAAALLDGAKGFGPVLLARWLDVNNAGLAVVGLGAIAGHMFPVFLGFRGGLGLATTVGVTLALLPLPALVGIAVFLALLPITRNVGWTSLVLFGLTLLLAALLDEEWSRVGAASAAPLASFLRTQVGIRSLDVRWPQEQS
jgi:glycerol-3-phosphate acyltransferase PlsY